MSVLIFSQHFTRRSTSNILHSEENIVRLLHLRISRPSFRLLLLLLTRSSHQLRHDGHLDLHLYLLLATTHIALFLPTRTQSNVTLVSFCIPHPRDRGHCSDPQRRQQSQCFYFMREISTTKVLRDFTKITPPRATAS